VVESWQWASLLFARLVLRGEQRVILYLLAENRVLREVLKKERGDKRLLLTVPQKRMLARFAKDLGRKLLGQLEPLFRPDTLLHWHRQFVAAKYSGRKRTGRKPLEQRVRDLVIRLASENECWGYRRIVGVLKALHETVSAASVRRILLEAGIEPSPGRERKRTWQAFLKAQVGSLVSADFFTTEVWTLTGLRRFQVLVVMDIISRRVRIGGIVDEPTGEWVVQRFREMTFEDDPFLKDKNYLIVDRGTVFTDKLDRLLKGEGIKLLRLPPSSPNLNAHVERFNRTIKDEALNRVILFGEAHLRRVVEEFAEFYHEERPHQGIGNRIIDGTPGPTSGEIHCRERLGGLLKFYHRIAA